MESIGLVVLALVAVCSAYKTGAPTDVCGDMTPQHGVPPLTTKSPYSIKLSRNKIKPGETLDVTISGSEGFKGFMIEARVGSTPIGRFTVGNDAKTINCGSGIKNAVTHVNNQVKPSVKVTWTSPKDLSEQVIMYYTVVKDGGKYWVALKSQPITVS